MTTAKPLTGLREFPAEASRVPVRTPSLQHDTGDGEFVVYVMHTHELLMFNDVGAGVYLLLDGQRTVGDILELMLDVLPTDPAVALLDLSRFLEHLAERGAVSFRPAQT
jgi:hypothetical protein